MMIESAYSKTSCYAVRNRMFCFDSLSYAMALYRKVIAWARVQLFPGLKVVALVPEVTPLSFAHKTGL